MRPPLDRIISSTVAGIVRVRGGFKGPEEEAEGSGG